MNDLISIIVPVYNSEKYLDECLNSILKQIYANLEIILVDDGSTDDSGLMCDKFAKKDKRVSVFHTDNNGQSSARNLGISNANGKYITFIDSDDYVEPSFIKFLYDNLVEHNVDISCCGYSMFYPNGKFVNKGKKNIQVKLDRENSIKYLIVNGLISDSPCNKLFKKELFSSIQFPMNKVYEDRRILPVIFYKANNIYYDSTVEYYYRQHSESTTHNENKLYQLIDATNERKIFIDDKYQNLKKYTSQDVILSYMTVSNFMILGKKYNKFYDLHYSVKEFIKNNEFTYKNLKTLKKIQVFTYINFPNVYLNLIKIVKK